MGILSRFVERRRGTGRGRYVCTLCGATYDERAVVVCPKCRGFVTERDG